jgi:GntR family transcriptional regulator
MDATDASDMPSRQNLPMPGPEVLSGRRRRADEAARIRDLLRVEIVAGRYSEHDLLPSEPELMLEYGVGRNVVRDSLDMLRTENIIERIQGSGTFVLATKAQHRLDRVHGIHDSVRRSKQVTGKVISLTTVTAPRPIAARLGIRPGERCTLTEYTAVVSGAPFSVSLSYLPLSVGERLDPAVFRGDFYQWLEAANCVVDGGELSVEAIMADERAAAALEVATGAPLIMFRRKLASPEGDPLEFGFVRCRGDRLSLNIQLPRAVKENGA